MAQLEVFAQIVVSVKTVFDSTLYMQWALYSLCGINKKLMCLVHIVMACVLLPVFQLFIENNAEI